MEDNKVIEIYDRIYKFVEKLIQEEYGQEKSLEWFFRYMFVSFKKCLFRSIDLLCKKNREFLVNEGYIRHIYDTCRHSAIHDKRTKLVNLIDNLKYFNDDDWVYIVERYIDYLNFIDIVQKNPNIYAKHFDINEFLTYEIDSELMENYDFYIKNRFLMISEYYYLHREIICFIYMYSYINKIDIDLEEVYSKIDIDEIGEYLLLNNVFDLFIEMKDEFIDLCMTI